MNLLICTVRFEKTIKNACLKVKFNCSDFKSVVLASLVNVLFSLKNEQVDFIKKISVMIIN